MNITKKLFNLLLLGTILGFMGCSDNAACDGKQCSDSQLLDAATCECITIITAPCNGKTCMEGEVLDAATCECVNAGTGIPTTETLISEIKSNKTLTADRIYFLQGKTYVTPGVTLTIEPGVIIKGVEGTGTLASALIIARGAKIEACGTAAKPIIFTSELDNIELGQTSGTNLTKTDRELWGGLIVLGEAPISAKDGDTESQIEGIPGDVEYGKFGGHNPMDNSGTLCFISIRHGGALIGDDNEINGLTLGGVGNGTSINNIEIIATLDDGIEFFGGTVNVSNVVVVYQGDDAIDIDMNYSGTIDNVYIIHGGDDTDEAFEIDGPENSTYTDGKFTILNATAIAEDTEKTSPADLKSKAQGTIKGVSWKGYKIEKGIAIRASYDVGNNCAEKLDAYSNAISGDLIIMDCEFVLPDATLSDMARVYTDSKSGVATELQACLDASDSQGQIDAIIGDPNMNNRISSSATMGAVTSVFSWSWAASHGLIN